MHSKNIVKENVVSIREGGGVAGGYNYGDKIFGLWRSYTLFYKKLGLAPPALKVS